MFEVSGQVFASPFSESKVNQRAMIAHLKACNKSLTSKYFNICSGKRAVVSSRTCTSNVNN